MNFDDDDVPVKIADYRRMQAAIPGVDGFYRLLGAIGGVCFPAGGRVLVVGAGGGRELETLGSDPKGFSFLAVDPSSQMLAVARTFAEAAGCLDRTTFLQGEVFDVPGSAGPFDAATSLLVMHFLADDGAKLAYLKAIREHLKPGALYVHADTSFDDAATFERLEPVFLRHAELAGLSPDDMAVWPSIIADAPIIGEARTLDLFRQAGFVQPTPYFRGLWYRGWLCIAA